MNEELTPEEKGHQKKETETNQTNRSQNQQQNAQRVPYPRGLQKTNKGFKTLHGKRAPRSDSVK